MAFGRTWARMAEGYGRTGQPGMIDGGSERALRGRAALASIWEFELEVSITPPVPIVGLEFDEVLGIGDLRAPLDRRVWKRVRLVAVD